VLGEPEGKRPIGRYRRRKEDNIKMDKDIGWGGAHWTDMAQDRDKWRAVVSTAMNHLFTGA
jgi:hypothetical protein